MRVACGTDIIEVKRIQESIEELKDKFVERIFTKREIEYCESKKSQKYQHYAARFAAKEAIFKAVSTFLEDKYSISWQNAEITNDEKGKPKVNFVGVSIQEKIEDIDISISHIKEYAVATVVIAYR